MFYPSAWYRAKARSALKGRWQTALLIALIVNLPTMLVQGIAAFTGNDPVDKLQAVVVTASRDGVFSRELLIREIQAFLSSTGFLATQGLNLAAWLITPCLALGMYKWVIDLLRGREGPVSTALCLMKLFLKAIGLQLLIILKVLAWMLPGIAATVLAMIPLYNAGADQTAAVAAFRTLNTMTLPLMALMAVPGVMAALRYAMAEYILADEPGTRILECVRISKNLMKDRKKNLFFLMVSFLLYYLLQLLVASFLSGAGSNVPALMFQMFTGLALNVYMSASVAAFFLQVTGEEAKAPENPDAGEELN